MTSQSPTLPSTKEYILKYLCPQVTIQEDAKEDFKRLMDWTEEEFLDNVLVRLKSNGSAQRKVVATHEPADTLPELIAQTEKEIKNLQRKYGLRDFEAMGENWTELDTDDPILRAVYYGYEQTLVALKSAQAIIARTIDAWRASHFVTHSAMIDRDDVNELKEKFGLPRRAKEANQ